MPYLKTDPRFIEDAITAKKKAWYEKFGQHGDPALFIDFAAAEQKLAHKFQLKMIEETPPTDYGFMANRAQESLVWYPRANNGTGYEDNTCTQEPIDHFNTLDLLARFFIQTHAQWGMIANWRQNVIGITSYFSGTTGASLPGGAHMPMFDYDGKNIKKIIRQDVKALQEEYGLGRAWVYETRRGFHVYFFTDIVSRDDFYSMLEKAQCCNGYKKAARNRGYAILRVSAKYTDFDISPLYVLEAKTEVLKRMSRKAHTIRALIDLGIECGTHFACMFPQWAHFTQDPREWKASTKKPSAKRIKKAPKITLDLGNNAQFVITDGTGFITTSTSTTTTNPTVGFADVGAWYGNGNNTSGGT